MDGHMSMEKVARTVTALLLAACTSGSTSGAASGSGVGSGSSSSVGSVGSGSSSSAGTGGSSSAGTGGNAGHGGATGACATCDGACVDLASDPRHCGGCTVACDGQEICDRGACRTPSCLVVGPICPNDHLCCGDECCPSWKMCCNVPGSATATCISRDAGACPTACAGCM
jgi:hypothetical protein